MKTSVPSVLSYLVSAVVISKEPYIQFTMEEPDTPDHYFLLEIDQTATEREVTKSYRKMSLKWHPDKNPGRQKEAQSNMVKVIHHPQNSELGRQKS